MALSSFGSPGSRVADGVEAFCAASEHEVRAVVPCDLVPSLRPARTDAGAPARYRVITPCPEGLTSHHRVTAALLPQVEARSLRIGSLLVVLQDDRRALFGADGDGRAVAATSPEWMAFVASLFEAVWDMASPVPAARTVLAPRQRAILELLADGLTDAAAASRLGVCERTIRREVSVLMQGLGVTSRFQLGLHADRLIGMRSGIPSRPLVGPRPRTGRVAPSLGGV